MALRSELNIQEVDEKQPLKKHKDQDYLSRSVSDQIAIQAIAHQLPQDGSGILNWKKLPQEIVNNIASYIFYKEGIFKNDKLSTGLIALRLVSKKFNKLIEKTPEGQIARKAYDHEPNFIRKKLAKINSENYVFGSTIGATTVTGTVIGGVTCFSIGLVIKAGACSLIMCIPGGIFGGGVGYCVAGPVGEAGACLVNHGLFKNKQYVENRNKEVNEERAALKQPVVTNNTSLSL